ncbi:MAG: hypothetical protein ACLRM9_07240 [Collinsella aerofaciens]
MESNARGDTDAGGDEAGDAQNKADESKDFESLASEAHGWSFRYEYANWHPMYCTYGEAHCSSTGRCMRLKASLACAVQPSKGKLGVKSMMRMRRAMMGPW